MIPTAFLHTVATKYGLSNAERQAVALVVDGKSTKAIAKQLDISEDAVRKRLSEVYRKCQIEGRGPVKLAKLQQMLMAQYQDSQQQQPLPTSPESDRLDSLQDSPVTLAQTHSKVIDWGEAPAATQFYGRQPELTLLSHWIQRDHCRLLLLHGLRGMGKTTLAVKIAEKLSQQKSFDGIIWRSLQHAPSLDQLLDDLFASLAIPLPAETQEARVRITQLLTTLRSRRYLIILDNGESLLRQGDFAGQYLDAHQPYSELFQRIGEARHQSCLLITSTEKFRDITLIEGEQSPVRSMQLEGLQVSAAIELLAAKGLNRAEEKSLQKLITIYDGNPLALTIIAATIKLLFDGSVYEFFNQNTTFILQDIRDLIEEQFMRLSEVEKEIMFWLALSPTSLDLKTIQASMLTPIDMSELMQALTSLSQRSLLEKDHNHPGTFKLQDVILEYVIGHLFELAFREICQLIRSYEQIAQQDPQQVAPTLRQLLFARLKLFSNLHQQSLSEPLLQMRNKLINTFVMKMTLIESLKDIQTWLESTSLLETTYARENLTSLLLLLETASA